jgi:flagellar biogenesis protein FliO
MEFKMQKSAFLGGIFIIFIFASTGHAYVGPGAGAGTIAAILGILGSIFLAFVAILWYPFKRLIRRFKKYSSENKVNRGNEMSNDVGSNNRN